MSEHHWFDALLASVHVSPFVTKGDEDGFFKILSRELDNEVKGRDAVVLDEHEKLNTTSMPSLYPSSIPFTEIVPHMSTGFLMRINGGLISVSF
jgi:hypothetical protein